MKRHCKYGKLKRPHGHRRCKLKAKAAKKHHRRHSGKGGFWGGIGLGVAVISAMAFLSSSTPAAAPTP